MGIDYVYATLELRKRVINPFPPPAEADLNLHKASGDGWGYNFGALIGLTDSTTLGLSFRSLVNLHIEGDADFSAPISVLSGRATTNLKMPPVAVIGLSHYFSPNLALEVDAQWTGWSSFQSLEIAFENPLASAPPIPRGWRDVFAIRMGGEYRVNDRLALRAGYIFDETPVPNDTVDPVLQDSTRDNLAVGMGYTVGSWTTDVAYNAFFLRDRKVDNVVTGVTQQGTYETLAHLIGVNLTYRF
jgi:long-chain fatty acid transport protein